MTNDMQQILKLALPAIISNITVPLLGLVDLTIVGHMGNEVYIAAIAIGSMAFNVIYWLFGFLRMGTSGMTAQALGQRDGDAILKNGIRSLTIAVGIGLLMVVLRGPLRWCVMEIMQVQPSSAAMVRLYFDICIFGAPACLAMYSLTGWFIGLQTTRIPMIVAIAQNVINIVLSVALVYGLGMNVEGVALGTTLSQWIAFAVSLVLAVSVLRLMIPKGTDLQYSFSDIFCRSELRRFFSVNSHIFLRTLCLVAVNTYFTSAGSAQGTMMLAVNTLLMTLFTIFSYVMDGFAYAGEALAGRHYGSGDRSALQKVVRQLLKTGTVLSCIFTIAYALGGNMFLSLITDNASVLQAASPYRFYTVMIPLLSFMAFIYDGVFIGITATRQMLVSCAIAAALFFLTYITLSPFIGNNALWTAYLAFLACRGAIQHLQMRSI